MAGVTKANMLRDCFGISRSPSDRLLLNRAVHVVMNLDAPRADLLPGQWASTPPSTTIIAIRTHKASPEPRSRGKRRQGAALVSDDHSAGSQGSLLSACGTGKRLAGPRSERRQIHRIMCTASTSSSEWCVRDGRTTRRHPDGHGV